MTIFDFQAFKSDQYRCVCVCVSVRLTVDAHLPVAVLLQQKLDVRAGRGDVLGTVSDSRAQPVSLVKQERQTAHGRPAAK